MKNAKTLAVAAVAAAALIAMLGIGTASATVLCENNLNTASCGQKIEKTTLVEAKLVAKTKAKLEPGIETIECEASAIGGRTENKGSSTETVRLPDTANKESLTVTFGTCLNKNCTLTVLKTGDLEVHHIVTTDDGTLTSDGLEITTFCKTIFGDIHCFFLSSKTDIGTLKGGNPAKLEISASVPFLKGVGLCAPNLTWKAEYEVTNPKQLYVSAE